MSIYTMKIIGEANDVAPVIKKENIVIKTKHNGVLMMSNSVFSEWDKVFIFPDSEKAEYFAKNFKEDMHKFTEGMLKDDYIFHIINCVFPEPEEVYADQMQMYS